jgi:hypothetical protein
MCGGEEGMQLRPDLKRAKQSEEERAGTRRIGCVVCTVSNAAATNSFVFVGSCTSRSSDPSRRHSTCSTSLSLFPSTPTCMTLPLPLSSHYRMRSRLSTIGRLARLSAGLFALRRRLQSIIHSYHPTLGMGRIMALRLVATVICTSDCALAILFSQRSGPSPMVVFEVYGGVDSELERWVERTHRRSSLWK